MKLYCSFCWFFQLFDDHLCEQNKPTVFINCVYMNATPRTFKSMDGDHKTGKTFSCTYFDGTPLLWLLRMHFEVLLGSDMPSQGRQLSPYLRRSLSLSGTHSQGDMCSCNSLGCFCISHCHKGAGLPSTRQCLQAVSTRQEVDMITRTSHKPPTLYLYWFCPSLSSLTQYFYATLKQTHSVLFRGDLLLMLVETFMIFWSPWKMCQT